MMAPPPLDQEDVEMLVPRSDVVEGPQLMEGPNSMVKQKPKQLAARPPSKAASRSSALGASKLDFDTDLCGEDEWVMVRKQRVIIWVPSLPLPDNCTVPKPAPTTQSQAELGKVADTRQVPPVDAVVQTQQGSHPETCHEVATADKPEKPNSLDPASSCQPTEKAISQSQQDPKTESENPRRVSAPKLRKTHRSPTRVSKPILWPRAMCISNVHEGSDTALLKQRLRASNLEKKIQKAGGLNEWLGTIGLGEKLERIFKGKRMSKFQVANLTMEKLKQMGASAVGPRRKLIHAIRCVYHPYCLNASRQWQCRS